MIFMRAEQSCFEVWFWNEMFFEVDTELLLGLKHHTAGGGQVWIILKSAGMKKYLSSRKPHHRSCFHQCRSVKHNSKHSLKTSNCLLIEKFCTLPYWGIQNPSPSEERENSVRSIWWPPSWLDVSAHIPCCSISGHAWKMVRTLRDCTCTVHSSCWKQHTGAQTQDKC